jgi:hypothetical protein
MGNLFGTSQNAQAAAASQQENTNELLSASAQNQQNAAMQQEQTQMADLVNQRTAALQQQLGPTVSNPQQLVPLATIATSELGDQSTPSTSRSQLLGN